MTAQALPEITVRVRWTPWARAYAWFKLWRMVRRGEALTYKLVDTQGAMAPVRLRCWLLREGYERDLKREVWWKPRQRP